MMNFSKVMLGTVQFGLNYGVANTSGKPDFDTVKAILKAAYDGGINALDTAPAYGDSEEVIGKALKDLGLAGRFLIVTKILEVPSGRKAEEFFEESLRASLRRLQVNHLAAALLHREYEVGNLAALKTMKAKGLIDYAGISLNSEAFADKGSDADLLQVPASLLDHRFDRSFGQGERHCFVRGAYLQGMLLMPKEKIFIPEIRERREKLEKLGIPMAELSLRYLFAKAGSKSILTGVETLAQLQQNLALSQLPPLPETDLKAIEKIVFPPLPENMVSPFFWPQYKKEHNLA